jgi:hypothetical protein
MPSLLQSDDVIWAISSESSSNADYGAHHRPPPAWLFVTSSPIVQSGYIIKLVHELVDVKLIMFSDAGGAIGIEVGISP